MSQSVSIQVHKQARSVLLRIRGMLGVSAAQEAGKSKQS